MGVAIFINHRIINNYPLAATNPVNLGFFNKIRIVNQFQIINQSVGIGSNSQKPLRLGPTLCFSPAALTPTIDNFFICQNNFTARAPANRHLGFVSQTVFEKLKKNPLSPTVITRIRGIYFPAPAVGKTKLFHLLAETGSIFSRSNGRMDSRANSIIFRRQPKSVPTHRIQNIKALHSLFPG